MLNASTSEPSSSPLSGSRRTSKLPAPMARAPSASCCTGPRDALGEVEPEPGRADQNQQRHRHEDRQVEALERPAQDASYWYCSYASTLRRPCCRSRPGARETTRRRPARRRPFTSARRPHQQAAAFERIFRRSSRRAATARAAIRSADGTRARRAAASASRRREQRCHLRGAPATDRYTSISVAAPTRPPADARGSRHVAAAMPAVASRAPVAPPGAIVSPGVLVPFARDLAGGASTSSTGGAEPAARRCCG